MTLYHPDLEKEAFAKDPPNWAKDPFNADDTCKCPDCGAWWEIVRPGKHQPVCDCQDSICDKGIGGEKLFAQILTELGYEVETKDEY